MLSQVLRRVMRLIRAGGLEYGVWRSCRLSTMRCGYSAERGAEITGRPFPRDVFRGRSRGPCPRNVESGGVISMLRYDYVACLELFVSVLASAFSTASSFLMRFGQFIIYIVVLFILTDFT